MNIPSKPDNLCHTVFGGDQMEIRKPAESTEDLRLNPQRRLCAKFDSASIAEFPVAPRDKMGIRVLDNCAEEHIM